MLARSLLAGLVDYWPLHEASGDAYGMNTANQLTDTNTVTQNPGIVDFARQFTAANSERFTVASNANLQAGDIDFTVAAWVYLDSKPANNIQGVSKDSATAGAREYILAWDNGGDRFYFAVYRATDSAKIATANNLGAPALSTWYFLVGWHDATGDTVNIEANGSGAIDSTATTGALQAASTAAFNIGARSNATQFWNGRICEVGFWKRILTQQERVWLYNNGLGRTWPFDGRPGTAMLGRHPLRAGAHRNRLTGVIGA